MKSNKVKLGDYLELSQEKNSNLEYGVNNVRGLSIQKIFIDTKANLENVNLSSYRLVKPEMFAYVTITSRNSEKITLAYNKSSETYLVSSSYIVFYVKEEKKNELLPEYLYLYFNRPEFDRYTRFNSWGSAREAFSWEDMCSIELYLPDVKIQRKYVDIFDSIEDNILSYEYGVDRLRDVTDFYINKLISEMPKKAIGNYIEQIENKNSDLTYGISDVRGISIEKKFIETKANMKDVSLSPYFIVEPNAFAYVPVTSRNGDKISIAFNDSENSYLVSSSYIVFKCISSEILPSYLFMYLSRTNFDRFARFNSWGSAREVLDWKDLCRYEIPMPSIEVQKDIVEIFNENRERIKMLDKLRIFQKFICPVLIKGITREA